MDPTNAPFELISYRGLLKSVDDFKKNNHIDGQRNVHNSYIKYGIQITKDFVLFHVFFLIQMIEKFLYFLMSGYDNYVYTPLQKVLSPIVKLIPRYIQLSQDVKLPIFTANIVTLSRTFLVIPIAWCLKYDYNWAAFFCVVYHDFLDHLDGIVAKTQKLTYPGHDDPLLGGFLDAFCDKIVNVFSIWTIIQTINVDNSLSETRTFLFLAICYGVVAYETVIGVVRVQDFFYAKFKKEFNLEDESKPEANPAAIVAASMEGKLKEKLESTGIAFLCVSISKLNQDPINNAYGTVGLVCLALTLRMAHKSLALKLENRKTVSTSVADSSKEVKSPAAKETITVKKLPKISSAFNLMHLNSTIEEQETTESSDESNSEFEQAEMKVLEYADNEIRDSSRNENYIYKKRRLTHSDSCEALKDQKAVSKKDCEGPVANLVDTRVDKVYTVGCFDLFHDGHVNLIRRMREIGKKVIVGVHDSRSIFKLKNRVPVDSTEKRMLNVKKHADEVFCVAGCDPSNYMTCVLNLYENETALYVRGDDMPNFPCRDVVEHLMPIKFLPYTEGVSSTQLRKEKFAHIANDDESYLEQNS